MWLIWDMTVTHLGHGSAHFQHDGDSFGEWRWLIFELDGDSSWAWRWLILGTNNMLSVRVRGTTVNIACVRSRLCICLVKMSFVCPIHTFEFLIHDSMVWSIVKLLFWFIVVTLSQVLGCYRLGNGSDVPYESLVDPMNTLAKCSFYCADKVSAWITRWYLILNLNNTTIFGTRWSRRNRNHWGDTGVRWPSPPVLHVAWQLNKYL